MSSSVVIAGIYSRQVPDGALFGQEDEFVVLVNMGEQSVDLKGWSITNRKHDRVHHFRYHFPRFLSNGDPWEVEPGALALLFTGRGTNGCTASTGEAQQFHLYQHRTISIWQTPGDTACLYDRDGRLIASYELMEMEPKA